MTWIAFRRTEIHDSDHSLNALPATNVKRFGHHLGLRPGAQPHSDATNERLKLGRTLDAAMTKDLTGKLGRYEAHLMRQLQQTRTELRELKAERAQRDSDIERGNT